MTVPLSVERAAPLPTLGQGRDGDGRGHSSQQHSMRHQPYFLVQCAEGSNDAVEMRGRIPVLRLGR